MSGTRIKVGKTCNIQQSPSNNLCLIATVNYGEMSLENQVEAFWKMEECSSKQHFTDEEILCKNHFTQHVSGNSDGRFIVRLPFKDNVAQFGESYRTAMRRFLLS